ncbi:MAG: glutamate--tRNA ligase, partial [Candidatus Zixiibacteriota bacterium]
MTDREVRVRIAPSPSGYLHVGTARTAIFNWLYARANGGKFLIRIEDTDVERSESDLIQPILDALAWLGMESDEEIVYQSRRTDRHRRFVGGLLESGHGYRCFCAKERLDDLREKARAQKRAPRYDRHCAGFSQAQIQEQLEMGSPFVVRLRVPEGETTYSDMVLGEITRSNDEIEDFVVARNDGSALYNFAVVVDDHEMDITHVIRGNDHITNTFKQIHIYRALEWEIPKFGHVPLLLRPDRRKVSKRLGDKDVSEYGAGGVLPQAMFNYLCLLGWSPKDGREIMDRDEILGAFSTPGINAANPVFDEQKLMAFNKEHIKRAPLEQLYDLMAPELERQEIVGPDWMSDSGNRDYVKTVIDLMRERLRVTQDLAELAG